MESQREIAGEAQRRAAELELQVQALRTEQSATAARLISRYRGTVERAAPRGTLRRDLYERALGRGLPAAAPEAEAAGRRARAGRRRPSGVRRPGGGADR